jgi:hypothetical protein
MESPEGDDVTGTGNRCWRNAAFQTVWSSLPMPMVDELVKDPDLKAFIKCYDAILADIRKGTQWTNGMLQIAV